MQNYHLNRALRIQESFQRLNEGLSYQESREQLKWFRIGILDGLLLEDLKDIEDKGKRAIDSGKNWIQNAYQKGKEMGSNLYDWAKGLVKKASDSIVNLKEKIVGNFNDFVTNVKKVYEDMKNEVLKGWEKVKDNVEKAKAFFEKLWEQIKNSVEESYKQSLESVIKSEENFKKWFKDFYDKSGDFLKRIANISVGTIVWTGEKISELYKFLIDGDNWKKMANIFIGFMLYLATESFKSVTSIYDYLTNKVKEYVKSAKEGFGGILIKIGEKISDAGEKMVGSSDETSDDKTEKIKAKYKELLTKWKEEQKKNGKNTNPGEGTRKRLKKEAAELVNEGFIFKKFETFNFVNER
jgi:ElaB/YqjD/DUF883 family membrane-anchored ribosome-binding protein